MEDSEGKVCKERLLCFAMLYCRDSDREDTNKVTSLIMLLSNAIDWSGGLYDEDKDASDE